MKIKSKLANWTRLQTIISVFARYGFSSIVHELGLPLPGGKRVESESHTGPAELRKVFEELGPTFIKLGQLLSTRVDLLPEAYVIEFAKLTDQAPNFSFKEVQEILETELGRDPFDLFESIEEDPIAAASISQVHRARLKNSDEKVVIKVQRPGITKTIEADIQILHFVASSLEKLREDFRLYNLSAIVQEFQRSIYEELDFSLEARNVERFRENFPEIEGIDLPKIHWPCSTSKVLTMTEMNGTPLSQLSEFPASIDRPYLAECLVNFFFESMFIHGLFHADAHAGNVLIHEGGRGKLALLDFGMVGTIGPSMRTKLSQLFLAIVSRDFETLALIYTDVGEFQKRFSLRDFQTDVSALISPHLGKPLKEVPIGDLLLNCTKIARKYGVRLPRDLVMFFRALVTLEHIGRKLDPDFDFLTYGKGFGQTLVKRRFSSEEILKDLFKTIEGIRSLGTELPAQIRTLVKRIDSSDFNLGGDSVEKALKDFRKTHKLTLVSFFTLVLLFTAALISSLRPGFVLEWPLWFASFLSAFVFAGMLLRK